MGKSDGNDLLLQSGVDKSGPPGGVQYVTAILAVTATVRG